MMRRLGLILVIVALAAAAVAALRVRATASAHWAAALEQQAALVGKLRAEAPARERLATGPVRPGDAWEAYDAGFAALATIPEAEAADPAGRAAQALARVRDGARRGQAAVSFDPASARDSWSDPGRAETALAGARRTAALLARIARERRVARDAEGALDVLGDAFQVAADVGRVPRLSVLRAAVGPLVDPGIDELREIVAGAAFSPGALLRLRQTAMGLDRSLPSSGRAFAGEYAVYCEDVGRRLGDPNAQWPLRSRRFGFSHRMRLAHLSQSYGEIVGNAAWRESLEWTQAATLPWPGDPDFVSQSAVPAGIADWLAAERDVRFARARLRLIIAAVAHRMRRGPRDPGWPADPFTLRPIPRRADGGRAVLWSEGTDGDQGGSGSWRPAPDKGDLVLDVPD